MAVNYKSVVLHTVDSAGNVIIYVPYTRIEQVDGAVLSVQGVSPDENGNIKLPILLELTNRVEALENKTEPVITVSDGVMNIK